MPTVTEASVAIKPTSNEMRPPTKQRTSKSRPASSVPHRCQLVSVGDALMFSQSAVSNAWGRTQGPAIQAAMIASNIHKLMDAARFLKNRRRASAHRLRGGWATNGMSGSLG